MLVGRSLTVPAIATIPSLPTVRTLYGYVPGTVQYIYSMGA